MEHRHPNQIHLAIFPLFDNPSREFNYSAQYTLCVRELDDQESAATKNGVGLSNIQYIWQDFFGISTGNDSYLSINVTREIQTNERLLWYLISTTYSAIPDTETFPGILNPQSQAI